MDLAQVLYRTGLGWIAGDRLVLLRHLGRFSGQWHETVLEVLAHDPLTEAYYVTPHGGTHADWYRDILQAPHVELETAGRRYQAIAKPVSPQEARAAFRTFGFRPPKDLRRSSHFAELTEQPGRLAESLPTVRLRCTAPVREPEPALPGLASAWPLCRLALSELA